MPFQFSVCTWNVLADAYAFIGSYSYCNPADLFWKKR